LSRPSGQEKGTDEQQDPCLAVAKDGHALVELHVVPQGERLLEHLKGGRLEGLPPTWNHVAKVEVGLDEPPVYLQAEKTEWEKESCRGCKSACKELASAIWSRPPVQTSVSETGQAPK
jgi:hypothetical protein